MIQSEKETATGSLLLSLLHELMGLLFKLSTLKVQVFHFPEIGACHFLKVLVHDGFDVLDLALSDLEPVESFLSQGFQNLL